MIRTIVAYVLAPIVVPIVMTLTAGICGLVFMPVGLLVRRLTASGATLVVSLSDCVGCFCAVYSMGFVCGWLKTEARLAMFALPVLLILGNALNYQETRKTGPDLLAACVGGCIAGIVSLWPMPLA